MESADEKYDFSDIDSTHSIAHSPLPKAPCLQINTNDDSNLISALNNRRSMIFIIIIREKIHLSWQHKQNCSK
jgi:hypothetical protein